MKNIPFGLRSEVESMWCVQLGKRSRWLAMCFVLISCLLSSYLSVAQTVYDFSTPAALSGYNPSTWPWNTTATIDIAGVSYTLTTGGNGSFENRSSGGDGNSPALYKSSAGGDNLTIRRTDGQKFQFYGVWLKHQSFNPYPGTPPFYTLKLMDGGTTVKSYSENNSTTETTYVENATVTSVSIQFNALNYYYVDNLVVGPAPAVSPTLTTSTVTGITSNAATLGGNVTADGGAPVTERGVVYSASNSAPTTSDTKTLIGNGTGSFSATVNGLSANTTYYVRAYAINSAGISYGTVRTFTTLAPPTLPQHTISFNGTNQYISVPTNSAFETNTATVEMWMKPNWTSGTASGNPTLLGIRSNTGTRYSIHISNFLNEISIWNGSTLSRIPFSFVQGNWYHVAAVMKPTATEIYINGNLIGTFGGIINTSVTGRNLNIGVAETPSMMELFKGEMDEIRVWNTARTATEILNNYGNPIGASSTGLVAYYKIEDGITNTSNATAKKVTDYTSNAFHGTLYNYFSANANLSSVTLSEGTLTPGFSSATTSYTATVSNATATVNITPTVSDLKATIQVNGVAVASGMASSVNLVVGSNTINVKVTAEDGTVKTYTVTVTRQQSSNADLANFVLNTGTLTPTFSAATTSYSVSLPNGTTSLTVTPTVAEANATVKVNGNTVTSGNGYAVNLNNGSNAITVLVTAQNGTTKTYNLNANVAYPALLASITAQTNVACFGGSNGSATVTANGGVAPYSYNWSPAGGTGQIATGLAAGTYTVTVTDNVGQTKQVSATITQPTAISISIVSTNVSCNGGSDGTATATVTGGAGNYTYEWSNAANSSSIASATAGTYTLKVTDANGCIATRSVTITEPATLVASVTLDANVSCNGGNNGGATVTVNGGTAPYDIQWSNGSKKNSIGKLAGDQLVAGTYTVTVTDAKGCSTNGQVTITQPAALTATFTKQDATTFGGTDGTATITVSGGTPIASSNYTYSWAPYGGNGTTASNLATGEYTVTVKDANDCSAQFKVFIDEPKEVSVVSISRTSAALTKASSLAYQVKLSGKLDGLATSHFSLSGIPSAFINGISKLSDDTYNVTITLPATESGELALTVANDTGLPAAITNLPYTSTDNYNVDHIAPVAPVAPVLAASSDSGVSDSDRLTNATSLTVSGETEANASVRVYINKAYTTTVNADADGKWTATLTPTIVAGLNELNITADAADVLGNQSAEGEALFVKVERDAPKATLTYSGATTVNVPFTVEVKFDEAVYGLATSAFDVSNGTVTGLTTTDAANYTITITPAGNGLVRLFLANASVMDVFGNENAVSDPIEVKFDNERPQVSLASTVAPTINAPFEVTVTFTEDVTGFEQSDVTVANGTVTAFETLNTKQFKATITPATNGEVLVSVAENVAQDVATNGNEASASLSRVYDATKPTVVLSTTAAEKVNAAFIVTATFSENVTGFEVGDITASNATLGNFTATSASVYTFVVTPLADGEVTLAVAADKAEDVATNGNEASAVLLRVYDATKPTVVLATTAANPTNAPFTVNVTFSEEVVGFEGADLSLTNATASNFNKVDGSHYSALITPTTDGAVAVSVAAGVATDIATNPNEASAALQLTYDATAPAGYAVAFNTNQVNVTNVTNIAVNVTGAEIGTTYTFSITSNNGGTPVTGTAQVQQAAFSLNGLDLTGLNDGTLTVIFSLTDVAGNKGADATAQVIKITRDIVAVTVPAVIKVPIRTIYGNVPMPAKVEVTYSTGAKELINVTWNQGNYNGMVAGPYYLTGQLVLAPMTTNLTNKIANVTVEVQPNKVPTALALSATTFKPEATANDALGTLTTTDPDDTEFVYTLVAGEGSKDNDLFEIRNDKVYLKSNKGLSGITSLTFRVKSTDPYFNTIEKSFTLTKEMYAKAEDQLKIVNAFSPDGDGINDTWFIPELRFYNNVVIEVFDRSGVRLFHTTNPEQGWDGRDANGQVRKGAFFYVVQVKDINMVKKGVVTIIKK